MCAKAALLYSVQGHEGKLVFGFMGEAIPVVLMVGRTQSVRHVKLA